MKPKLRLIVDGEGKMSNVFPQYPSDRDESFGASLERRCVVGREGESEVVCVCKTAS